MEDERADRAEDDVLSEELRDPHGLSLLLASTLPPLLLLHILSGLLVALTSAKDCASERCSERYLAHEVGCLLRKLRLVLLVLFRLLGLAVLVFLHSLREAIVEHL